LDELAPNAILSTLLLEGASPQVPPDHFARKKMKKINTLVTNPKHET
jgi:hypothetical protein